MKKALIKLPAQGNILVNDNGQACLGDFGIAQITTNPSATGSERTISSQPNACRYMPPELLHSDYDRCSYSDAGDIYSLAITAFEVNLSLPNCLER